jgi:hypothetical protein
MNALLIVGFVLFLVFWPLAIAVAIEVRNPSPLTKAQQKRLEKIMSKKYHL